MSDVTHILNAIEAGDPQAVEQLLPLVYDELRRLAAGQMARENPGHTLDATGLVHEVYLRLVGEPSRMSDRVSCENTRQTSHGSPGFANRRHFFAAAAEAMRRILVESARRKQARRHGGGFDRSERDPDEIALTTGAEPLETLAVHEALDRLAAKSPRRAELVKLRYFLGCTIPEAAQILGIAPATAEDDWTLAKAWLRRQLRRDGEENRSET